MANTTQKLSYDLFTGTSFCSGWALSGIAVSNPYIMGPSNTQRSVAKEKSMEVNKVVVLMSGGIDSLACYHYAQENYWDKEIIPLYVDANTKFSRIEIMAGMVLTNKQLKVLPMQWLGQFEDKVGHLPFRNLFLLEAGALFGDIVLFGMLHGELSEDKGFPFIKRMNKLFATQTKKNLYHDDHTKKIIAPFGKSTKTEVVRWLRSRGIPRARLGMTVGCMNGTSCGQCPPCFNRWVAFANNGIAGPDKKGLLIDSYIVHPAIWGLQELAKSRSNAKGMFSRSLLSVPLWEKRKWIKDVWGAYNDAYVSGVIDKSSWMIGKQIIGW